MDNSAANLIRAKFWSDISTGKKLGPDQIPVQSPQDTNPDFASALAWVRGGYKGNCPVIISSLIAQVLTYAPPPARHLNVNGSGEEEDRGDHDIAGDEEETSDKDETFPFEEDDDEKEPVVGAKQTSNKQADKSFDSSNDFDLDDDDVMEIMASVDPQNREIVKSPPRKQGSSSTLKSPSRKQVATVAKASSCRRVIATKAPRSSVLKPSDHNKNNKRPAIDSNDKASSTSAKRLVFVDSSDSSRSHSPSSSPPRPPPIAPPARIPAAVKKQPSQQPRAQTPNQIHALLVKSFADLESVMKSKNVKLGSDPVLVLGDVPDTIAQLKSDLAAVASSSSSSKTPK